LPEVLAIEEFNADDSAAIDLSKAEGDRNRAIIENALFFYTVVGLRVSELVNLQSIVLV